MLFGQCYQVFSLLFRYSFDKRVRKGADNPTIVDMARVKCPAELVELTQERLIFKFDKIQEYFLAI